MRLLLASDCAKFRCLLINNDMYLAPEAAFWSTMLASTPLAFTLHFDARTVYQKVQRSRWSLIGNSNGQRPLSPTQRTEVRHRPIQPDQFQQVFHKTRGLLQGKIEQHFDREAGLYGRIALRLLTITFSWRRCTRPSQHQTKAKVICVASRPDCRPPSFWSGKSSGSSCSWTTDITLDPQHAPQTICATKPLQDVLYRQGLEPLVIARWTPSAPSRELKLRYSNIYSLNVEQSPRKWLEIHGLGSDWATDLGAFGWLIVVQPPSPLQPQAIALGSNFRFLASKFRESYSILHLQQL